MDIFSATTKNLDNVHVSLQTTEKMFHVIFKNQHRSYRVMNSGKEKCIKTQTRETVNYAKGRQDTNEMRNIMNSEFARNST